MKIAWKKLIFCFLIVVCSSPAYAHYYWLSPNTFFFPKEREGREENQSLPEYLSFDFSGSETFFYPDLDLGLVGSDYQVTVTKPDGRPVALSSIYYGKTKMTADVALPVEGTYTVSVARQGDPIYFSDMKNGAYPTLPKDLLNDQERASLKETHAAYQNVKAYVSVHILSSGWEKPLNQTLELMPLSHPGQVKKDMPFRVQLLYRGKPLAGEKLIGVYAGYQPPIPDKFTIEVRTDSDGIATVTFDRGGRWLLHVIHETPATDTVKADILTYKSSLMLDVQDK